MGVLVTRRETAEGTLVSVCDADCLGETYEDGRVSLTVTEEFYGGDDAEEVDADAAVERLYGADTANLVGETSVSAAVEAGIVDEANVLEVDGIPHAQVLWL
jgi:hypothetical protein